MEHTRRTFDGREIKISEMTQQHLSNAYYFTILFSGDFFVAYDYLNELKDRFNGELLPYRPLASFPAEINALKNSKYVIGNKIYLDDRCIGEMPDDKIINDINDL